MLEIFSRPVLGISGYEMHPNASRHSRGLSRLLDDEDTGHDIATRLYVGDITACLAVKVGLHLGSCKL